MIGVGIGFVAGFASGWAVRSTVDSSRGVAVKMVAAYYATTERVKRLVAMEREHLEDLVAEARARYEGDRARTAAKKGAPPRSADAPRSERAA